MTLLPEGSVIACPKPSEARMTTRRPKAAVGTRPPNALMTDHSTIVAAMARVRFQRSASSPPAW